MKKIFMTAALAIAMCGTAMAQRQQMNPEQMQQMMAQRVQQQAERLVKDMELKDNQKVEFTALYTQYQRELNDLRNAQMAAMQQQTTNNKKEKDMTDEDYNNLIKEQFERETNQIALSLQQYQIKQKYYEQMKDKYTPKQLSKVFGPQRMGGNGGQRNGGGQRGGFGGGGFGGGQGGFGGGFGGGQGGFGGGFGGGQEGGF